MKRLVFFIFALFIVACQGNDGGGGAPASPQQIATTPLTTNCINGSSYCNGAVYGQMGGYFQPYIYPYGYNQTNYTYNYWNMFSQQGFCGCPGGYSPVYNGNYGLGCVSNQFLNGYQDQFYFWSYGYSWGYTTAAPQATINIPQFSNIDGGSGQCSRQLLQSCVVNQGNAMCDAGATCRSVLPGSNLGVCSRY